MTDSGVQTRNISQTQKATLNSIRDLQRLENQLYKKLEQTTATPNTLQEQRALIRRIDNITKVRKSLLNTLTDRYSDIQNNVISSRSDLVQQTAMVGVIQDEMRKANNNLTELETDKNNKLRMVELNTYAREISQFYGDDENFCNCYFYCVNSCCSWQKENNTKPRHIDYYWRCCYDCCNNYDYYSLS